MKKLNVEIPDVIFQALGNDVETLKQKIVEGVRIEYETIKFGNIQSQLDELKSTAQSEAKAELEQITIEEL